MMKIQHIICCGLMGLGFMKAQAQIGSTRVTTTAVPFLRVSTDARSGGMGDVSQALTPDANATFYNAAKLPFASSSFGISANYSPWMKEITKDMYMASIGAFKKLGDQSAISLGFRYFNMGDIEELDYNGTFLQNSKPREYAVDLAYSRKVSDRNGLSLTGRYIHSSLMSGGASNNSYQDGSTVAADLAFFHNGLNEAGKGWNWGVALTNLGGKISYSSSGGRSDFLPTTLTAGLGYRFAFNADNALMLTGDVRKLMVPSVPLDSAAVAAYPDKTAIGGFFDSFSDYRQVTLNAGAEYSFKDQFMLRAGYSASTPQEGTKNYFTAGAGVAFRQIGLNFSYLAPFTQVGGKNPLSNTMRFGILFNPGKK